MKDHFVQIDVPIDRYNGLTVDLRKLPEEDLKQTEWCDEKFENNLVDSLNRWIQDGRRSVWFMVPSELTRFIPVLIRNKFEFHHTELNLCVLTRWIKDDEPNRLPKFAHTTIGIGGIVYHPIKEKVLLIQEKNSPVKMWKFPGGYSEPNENFSATAIREVFEETGILCDYVSMISFRHDHRKVLGCSNIYFVCLLVPQKLDEISMNSIEKCQFEIDDCCWFDLPEARSLLLGFNRFVMEKFLQQYSLLEFSNLNVDRLEKQQHSYTIRTELIHTKYGPHERDEQVYFVHQSDLSFLNNC
ncbi:hypothetical protein NH340_JMT06502 [Sarcoptes scabiei]|nr:hypothetical protein NH340_JMT06502 [Sarcoptes scabiei]